MARKNLETLPEWWHASLKYRYDIGRFATEALGMTYTWQQAELFTHVAEDGSRVSVSSGHGCFAKGTPIMLADGSVLPVEEITINHYLMGDDRQSQREVLYLERGTETMFRFTYEDGSSHTFNESHILCLIHRDTHEKKEITVKTWNMLKGVEQSRYCIYRVVLGVYHLLGIHHVENIGEGKYYGFLVDGNHKFLAGDGTVFHNTGKTRSAGVIALWHLCFFPHSVMMFTAPQIQQLRKLVWKEIEICLGLMRNGPLAWLADYITVLAEMVYINGSKNTWHVYAKTAPKGNPQALAGNHGDYLMIWGDEAAAIDDPVFDVLTGALTHPANRMALTSQPARSAGFFYDTHHRLSSVNGGVWTALKFNSELSGIVSPAKILEARLQYGDRDDPQYMIRIRGEFPDLAGEYIITEKMAQKVYRGNALIKGKHDDYGYFILVDVGGGVGRDDSTITIAKVWGVGQWGVNARRAEVVKIPLCKNNDNLHELTAVIHDCMIEYPNATLLVDANGAGTGLAQHLKSIGLHFKAINWGGQCFSNQNRKHYVNKRAQAFVALQRAITAGRFKVKTLYLRGKLTEQLTKIPYTFDDQARFKILSKKEMLAKNIKSPDLVDTLAFIFLEGTNYTPANESTGVDPENYGHGDVEPVTPDSMAIKEADDAADLLD